MFEILIMGNTLLSDLICLKISLDPPVLLSIKDVCSIDLSRFLAQLIGTL